MPLAHIITEKVITICFAGGRTYHVRSDRSEFNQLIELIKHRVPDEELIELMEKVPQARFTNSKNRNAHGPS